MFILCHSESIVNRTCINSEQSIFFGISPVVEQYIFEYEHLKVVFDKNNNIFVNIENRAHFPICGPILTLMVRAKLELWFLCIHLFSQACSWLTFADTVGTVISKASGSPHSVSTLIIVDILFLFLFPLVIVLKLIRVRQRFKLLVWN